MVYSRKITLFTNSPYYSFDEEMDMTDLGMYSSFNMVFGVSAPGFDWFNNPYLSATVYEPELVNDGEFNKMEFQPSKKVKFDYCKN